MKMRFNLNRIVTTHPQREAYSINLIKIEFCLNVNTNMEKYDELLLRLFLLPIKSSTT